MTSGLGSEVMKSDGSKGKIPFQVCLLSFARKQKRRLLSSLPFALGNGEWWISEISQFTAKLVCVIHEWRSQCLLGLGIQIQMWRIKKVKKLGQMYEKSEKENKLQNSYTIALTIQRKNHNTHQMRLSFEFEFFTLFRWQVSWFPFFVIITQHKYAIINVFPFNSRVLQICSSLLTMTRWFWQWSNAREEFFLWALLELWILDKGERFIAKKIRTPTFSVFIVPNSKLFCREKRWYDQEENIFYFNIAFAHTIASHSHILECRHVSLVR